ncbi:hypothetical protein F4804DRAFT_315853 [Jackrogersella minutella]|nr:hypothetical protein F4804DRAFT_315853 [Jackrogersella minutella]
MVSAARSVMTYLEKMKNTELNTRESQRVLTWNSSLTAHSGICAVRGVLDVPFPKHFLDNPSMLFFMGATGVFGYTDLTQADQNKLLYWSIYETVLPARGPKLERDLMIQKLREHHGN